MAVLVPYDFTMFGWKPFDWVFATGGPASAPNHALERLGWWTMYPNNSYFQPPTTGTTWNVKIAGWEALGTTAENRLAWLKMIQSEKKDVIDGPWLFRDGGVRNYDIESAIRIPYFTTEVGSGRVYVEYLLIGTHKSNLQATSAGPWNFSSAPATSSVASLGKILFDLAKGTGGANDPEQVQGWDVLSATGSVVDVANKRRWEFRCSDRKIDKVLRIPYFKGNKLWYWFVGYEGGAAY